jgi:hypothetical protein
VTEKLWCLCAFSSAASDDRPDYEAKLQWTCENIHLERPTLGGVSEFPSIQFGVEMAFQSLAAKSPFLLFPSEFTEVKIHPNQWLVWMEGGIYEGTEEKA